MRFFNWIGILGMGLLMSSSLFAGPLASGTISIDSKIQAAAKGIKTLFIIVYDVESPRPMPYGAIKADLKADAKGSFYSFSLTTDNIRKMMPAPEPKNLRIKARLDKDGSAGMDSSGDIVGEVKPIKAGSKGVQIVLNILKK